MNMYKPETESDVSDILASARTCVFVRGGGTRASINAGGGDAVSTEKLSGVVLYEPGALTMVARAGTPVDAIDEVLAQEGQRLAFEPMDHRAVLGTAGTPTIGGVFSANVSGPRRLQSGAARDFALGIRAVDGTGRVIKNGGRVMKNVTGYDLVKLFCGAWGTLGILTEVSFKVLPIPEAEATLRVHGVHAEAAVQAMAQAMGSPFDVTAAAYDPVGQEAYIRLEGFETSVSYRSNQLKSQLGKFGEVSQVSGQESHQIWKHVRDVRALASREGDIWKVSVKPSDGPRVLKQLDTNEAVLDWAGGLVWACVPAGTPVRSKLSGLRGHATLVRAAAETFDLLGRFHPEAPAVAALSAGLRAKFDPRGLLNPGLMSQPDLQAAG